MPVLYVLDDQAAGGVTVTLKDGSTESSADAALSREQSKHLFYRDGEICQITVTISSDMILS